MTKEQEFFNAYCLDRMKVIDNELPISYNDEGFIRKIYYKIGLIAKVRNILCYILYTEDDFENFVYIPQEYVLEHELDLRLNVQKKSELFEYLKIVNTTNIFQFISLFTFDYIYQEFKDIVDYNWANLSMDKLIYV